MDFENDEEFLSEASSLLGLEMTMTYLDLKDSLRELGYFGDWNDSDNILTFLQAENYSKQIAEKKLRIQEGEIYKRLFKSIESGTPPSTISQKDFFQGVDSKIKSLVMKEIGEKDLSKFLGGAPMITPDYFTPAVSDATSRLLTHLNQEYLNRRLVLLKRLDVTMIQSFNWSQRAKQNSESIISKFQAKRSQLDKMMESGVCDIGFEDLVVARENLLWDSKTSHGDKRCVSRLNCLIMKGSVPDRGGRADEQYFTKESFKGQEDVRNMPKFQSRSGQAHNPNDLSQYRGGGSGRGRGRGGDRGRGNYRGRGNNSPHAGGDNNRPNYGQRDARNDINENNRNHNDRGNNRGRGRGRGRGGNINVNFDSGFQGKNF